MKKILVLLALVVFSFANAQKGSVLVMGSVSYYSQNTSSTNGDDKQNTIIFQPKLGYQFHENWTAGVEADYSRVKQDFINDTGRKDRVYSFGGFLRYTKPLNQTFSAYADLGVGYQNRKEITTLDTGRYYTDSDGIYASITPAIFIDVYKGLGLNFNIGGLNYNVMNYDGASGESSKIKSFNFTLGQAFSVGISKNF